VEHGVGPEPLEYRVQPGAPQIRDLEIDLDRFEVRRAGRVLALTPAGFSSLVTVAVLVTVWAGTPAATAYGTPIVQVAAGARLAGRLQAIVLPSEAVQSPPRSAVGPAAVKAAGTLSARRTVSASDGPWLVTRIV